MNLTGDPWIPILFENGQNSLVSLVQLFEESRNIRDLTVNPPQRIALMRLIICITQVALDGPEDEKDWKGCRDKIIPACRNYLNKRKEMFELYGPQPFMQIEALSSDKIVPIDKLDCCLASGNNPTLFDHRASISGRTQSPATQALNLITCLNFSTGGKVGQAIWKNNRYSDSTFAAPCIKAMHTLIRGENLHETIFFNLLAKKTIKSFPNGKWGYPVWDFFPRSPDDTDCFENAGKTYLGRLVPLSRFINLSAGNEKECIIGPTFKSFKINHLPAFREPSMTVIQTKKGDPIYLPLSSEKHIWRELGSVINLSVSMEQGGAACLQNIQQVFDFIDDSHIDIWVGGLEVGAQAAKLNDMVEWNLSLPLGLFDDTVLTIYQNGVTLANNGELALKNGVTTYYADQAIAPKEMTGVKKKAAIIYWTILDNNYQLLINIANRQQELDEWKKLIYSAMHKAYRQTCSHETPRQIQAFSKGRMKLFIKNK